MDARNRSAPLERRRVLASSRVPWLRGPAGLSVSLLSMIRPALALLCAAALGACGNLGEVRTGGYLGVTPLLDSLFVGEQEPPHQVTFIDIHGNPAPAGTVVWSSVDNSIAEIDATGRVTARKRGAVLILAQAQGLTAGALVVVSDPLDITLLLDTVYVMPNDTLALPVPDLYVIDSLNPGEDVASSVAPPAICSPPRPWAYWAARAAGIFAYSSRGGELGITQIVPVTDGQAISGHFTYSAQRTDYYTDPLALLSIHGSFVAPLVASTTV